MTQYNKTFSQENVNQANTAIQEFQTKLTTYADSIYDVNSEDTFEEFC